VKSHELADVPLILHNKYSTGGWLGGCHRLFTTAPHACHRPPVQSAETNLSEET
jgi:hypothetical protein